MMHPGQDHPSQDPAHLAPAAIQFDALLEAALCAQQFIALVVKNP